MEEEMTRFYTPSLPGSNQMVAVTFPFNSLTVESSELPPDYLHLQPFQYNRVLTYSDTGGMIYSDSNGMQDFEAEFYSSSPISQNLSSLALVPDTNIELGQEPFLMYEGSNTEENISSNQYHTLNIPTNNDGQLNDQAMVVGHLQPTVPQLDRQMLPPIGHQSNYQWMGNNTNMQDFSILYSMGNTSSTHQPISRFSSSLPVTNMLSHDTSSSFSQNNNESQSSSFSMSGQGIGFEPSRQLASTNIVRMNDGSGYRKNKQKTTNKIQKPKGTPGRKVKVPDYELSPAEAKKRHIRRQRNKIAAAKCRNRRRELTDRLQGETDELQKQFHQLSHEERKLLQEKEHLEYILKTHSSSCKVGTSTGNQNNPQISSSSLNLKSLDRRNETQINSNQSSEFFSSLDNVIYDENNELQMNHSYHPHSHTSKTLPQLKYQTAMADSSIHYGIPPQQAIEPPFSNEVAINTPVCTLVTPSNSSSSVFTFPSLSMSHSSEAVTTNSGFKAQTLVSSENSYQSLSNQACLVEFRRRDSSSSDESMESNHSHNLLTL